jgi:hypothetical protein
MILVYFLWYVKKNQQFSCRFVQICKLWQSARNNKRGLSAPFVMRFETQQQGLHPQPFPQPQPPAGSAQLSQPQPPSTPQPQWIQITTIAMTTMIQKG